MVHAQSEPESPRMGGYAMSKQSEERPKTTVHYEQTVRGEA